MSYSNYQAFIVVIGSAISIFLLYELINYFRLPQLTQQEFIVASIIGVLFISMVGMTILKYKMYAR